MKRILFLISCLLLILSSCAQSMQTTTETESAETTENIAPTSSATTETPTPTAETTAKPTENSVPTSDTTTETPMPTTFTPTLTISTPTPTTITPTPDGRDLRKPTFAKRYDVDGQPTEIRFLVRDNACTALAARALLVASDDEGIANDSPTEEAIRSCTVALEEELGVKITVTTVDDAHFVGQWKTAVQTDEPLCDVIACTQYLDLNLVVQSETSCLNLSGEQEGNLLNLSAPYWDNPLNRAISHTSEIGTGYTLTCTRAVTGAITPSYTANVYVSYVNTPLWNEFKDRIALLESSGGYSDYYEIVKNGYWTIDFLRDLCELVYDDTNRTGLVDEGDRVGLVIGEGNVNNCTSDILASAFDVSFVEKQDVGRAKAALTSDRMNACCRKLYEVYRETKTLKTPYVPGDPLSSPAGVFAQGKALICFGELHEMKDCEALIEMPYDVLPLPLLTREQYDENDASLGYRTTVADHVTLFSIPESVSAERLPAVTATLELMAYYGYTEIMPAYIASQIPYVWSVGEDNARREELISIALAGLRSDFAYMWKRKLQFFSFNLTYLRCVLPNLPNPDEFLDSWNKDLKSELVKLYMYLEYPVFVGPY